MIRILFALVLALPGLTGLCAAERHAYYVDAAMGDDAAAGTIERPWKTLAASIPRLKPGDTLNLRAGVFFEKELSIAVRGTAEKPITIRNHPGETPVIDGAFREFRAPGNEDWELVDPEIELYASKKTYEDPKILHGYFEFRNTVYKLVGYDRFEDLTTKNEFASVDNPFYVGPGAHWKKSDGRIYVRLVQSEIAGDNAYSPPGFITDPRRLKLLLFGNGVVLRVAKESAHVRLEGLKVQGQETVLDFVSGGANNHVIKDCTFLGGRFHVTVGQNTHHLLFDGIYIDGGAVDWVGWLDVKIGRHPAKNMESPGIKTSGGVHHIEVRNSTFRRLFDGINANNGGHDFHIHDNLFEYIRDDSLQLGTHAYNVEFAYNRMLKVSKGPGHIKRGDCPHPGTKFFHHNIIDASKLWLFARKNPDGSVAKQERVKYINERGEVWARPVASHGTGAVDPWKFYHNTIIFGQELNGWGNGLEYMHGDSIAPGVPHEAYNNIVVQIADYPASSGVRPASGSQIFDGNLYYRVPLDAKHPFLRDWSDGSGAREFKSLEEFKASPLFAGSKRHYPPGFENSGIVADPRLDDEYRPAQYGPAASGAVPLPKIWPGNRGEKFRGALAPVGAFTDATGGASVPPAERYVDAVTGNDAATGTIDKPWKTLHASIPKLKPGDTLFLRGGTFFEKEIPIGVRGSKHRPITIRNFPGEAPVVDGAFHEFRPAGNSDWELVNAGLQLYASRKSYPYPVILHGYFAHRGVQYKLVGYDRYDDITAKNQFAGKDVRVGDTPIYVGPGAHWRKDDGKLYVRLVQSDIAKENGYALPDLPTDPRKVAMLLFGTGNVILAKANSAHVQLEGLGVQGQEHALQFEWGGASYYTVKNCRFLGGRFHVILSAHTHHILFDGVSVDGGAPDWIAWLDVKVGRKPAQHLESPAIRLTSYVRNVEVRNSSFRRLFDGINSNDGGAFMYIHHNRFEFIRDDTLQLGTHTHDVEFAYNYMTGLSKGFGYQGKGNSDRPGTKYFHHNIIDCSKQWLFARKHADGRIAKLDRVKYINEKGEVWARPVGSHGGRALDPWKIYHNTVLFGQELNGSGNGFEYMHGTLFDPATPHEVYNNIIIQIADFPVSTNARVADGSQVLDGNLYHRVPKDAKHPFLKQWAAGTGGARDFASLDEFKASPLFEQSKRIYAPGFENSGTAGDPGLDAAYRPAANGPAASGAVKLPAQWPGNRGETFRGALPPTAHATGAAVSQRKP